MSIFNLYYYSDNTMTVLIRFSHKHLCFYRICNLTRYWMCWLIHSLLLLVMINPRFILALNSQIILTLWKVVLTCINSWQILAFSKFNRLHKLRKLESLKVFWIWHSYSNYYFTRHINLASDLFYYIRTALSQNTLQTTKNIVSF